MQDERRAERDDARQRLVDLAAERAMQEQRAAAKGRVDDVRPAAQEATQRRERDAGSKRPAKAAEPSHGPQKTASAAQQTEPERAAPAAADRETRGFGSIVGGILGGIAKPIENFISALADLFAPPPPLTPDQAERKARADDEKAEARADEAVRQEKEAAHDEQISEQSRREQQTEQDFYTRFGSVLTRDPDRPRERDDDYDRGRERER